MPLGLFVNDDRFLPNDHNIFCEKTSLHSKNHVAVNENQRSQAFPFRSPKKYLVPERGKVRSFLDITGLGIQKPQILWILDWKEGRIKNLRLLEFFSQGKENICLQMAGCKDVKLDRCMMIMHKNKPVVAAVFRLRGKLSTAPEE